MPAGAFAIRWGMSLTVRTLAVISSPVLPSPRLAAVVRTPSVYVKEHDTPSILASSTISKTGQESVLAQRSCQARTSAAL